MADSSYTKRQALYERIRASSKDEVILEEMVRLGFWPEKGPPGDPANDLARLRQLRAELSELSTKIARTGNLEAMRREVHARRLRESREKQQQTKVRREQERQRKADAWRERSRRELLYLGAGVSGGLSAGKTSDEKRAGNEARLRERGLPVFADAADMAKQMGLTLGELRFLAFQRRVSTVHHYVRFSLPKKTGGQRLISAPMPRLKKAQHWVLQHLLDKVPVHDAAHGFRTGRSIVSNAEPHLRAAVVVNLDLRDFFPSVSYRRIRGVFRALGYGDAFATVLALLCSESDVDALDLDGKTYFVASGPRHLPQGAPTSPALTNVLCSRLDRRLTAVARRSGFVYTRYADDLTFSAPSLSVNAVAAASTTSGDKPAVDATPDVGRLLRRVRFVIAAEGFVVHPDKTRVLRRSRRQEVTGVVVNDKLSVDRATIRRFRALLFQIEREGLGGKHWGTGPDVLAAAAGYASFVAMVSPDRGRPLQAKVRELQVKHGGRPVAPAATAAAPAEVPVATPAAATAAPATNAPAAAPVETPAPTESAPEAPKKPWWKLF